MLWLSVILRLPASRRWIYRKSFIVFLDWIEKEASLLEIRAIADVELQEIHCNAYPDQEVSDALANG